ncbi:MAG: hypothetical protein A3A97_02725 [Candidatus Terrybacteria bacterium RIFCSPLOWO2_01_FULL_40_23]|uniref:Uncharacterized protein n=1 Tax=Candidatus Terrybacteria bacterium RIFCSPLOWO2_01_FULL_40_23 TaxID=1802366 RepID=A0A1G2PRW9_9BACT|nr:MAG: hypothetical protein A3A97_02725 [Candidatus Terrybacteria bacterium RIFCSPLOWO2_01_FULL_40_23]
MTSFQSLYIMPCVVLALQLTFYFKGILQLLGFLFVKILLSGSFFCLAAACDGFALDPQR